MSAPVVDLSLLTELFGRVYGTPVTAFDPEVTDITGDGGPGEPNRREQGILGSPYYANDATGREYFMPVTMTYTNTGGAQVTMNLPFPVIGIKGSKHVVDTELTERRGEVSELINTKAYLISIKGFCIDLAGDEMPEADVMALRDLFECGLPVSIKNPLTDIFLLRPDRSGSDLVTIRDFEMPFEIGVKGVKGYTLELRSEEPFNLIEI